MNPPLLLRPSPDPESPVSYAPAAAAPILGTLLGRPRTPSTSTDEAHTGIGAEGQSREGAREEEERREAADGKRRRKPGSPSLVPPLPGPSQVPGD